MKIICLTVGDLSTNCYLAIDEESKETLIIDPGDEGDFISTTVLENKLTPKAIILTHGHYDHCLATLELKLNFSIPIYLHRKDLFLYEKAHLSASYWSDPVGAGPRARPHNPPIDHFLTDNQLISFGHSSLKVLHTPGHTPGSVCLLSPSENHEPTTKNSPILFTGDTLFANGIGRTDLSYSSKTDLQKSLSKLRTNNQELITPPLIYPGHEDYGLFSI